MQYYTFSVNLAEHIERRSTRSSHTHPKDQNSDACISPLRGDSHLFTARMTYLSEWLLRNQSAISTSAAISPACSNIMF